MAEDSTCVAPTAVHFQALRARPRLGRGPSGMIRRGHLPRVDENYLDLCDFDP